MGWYLPTKANAQRALAVMCALSLMTACSSPPTQPSQAPALKSIRYVRTRPVVNPDRSNVSLIMEHPSARCFGCVGLSGTDYTAVSLTQIDPITFEYPFASSLDNIPADTEVMIHVVDEPVSLNEVASDIYVNGTKVSVRQSGAQEDGYFRVRSDGSIY